MDCDQRLRDAAAALDAAARAHPGELDLHELRRWWAEIGDALEALGGEPFQQSGKGADARGRDVVADALNGAGAAAYLTVV